MEASFSMDAVPRSLLLESTGSDRNSFEMATINSTGHDGYSSKPQQIYLFGGLVSGWKIKTPLLLTIDEDSGGNYVSDNEFHIYGYGKTKTEALEDYANSIIEYYQILAARDDEPTQALLSRLKFFLIPTSYPT